MDMVAKQGWRMMIKPEMLVARVFKARWSIRDGIKVKGMAKPWLREVSLVEDVLEDCMGGYSATKSQTSVVADLQGPPSNSD
ncbi:hypothetical protein KIW84_063978 [Lathyrus oleraceus]|uniref:Uncharacterized protein n=1 Tax=Pisum sativum TaxID=3888 RepID=A0A9D5A7H3_PEA|nr:hypothetical protein KIW84_063978 [Pisum sativum]